MEKEKLKKKLKIKPFLLVGGIAVLGIIIYFGLSTTPPAGSEKAAPFKQAAGIDLAALINKAKSQIDKKYLPQIVLLESELSASRNADQKAQVYKKMVAVWDSAGAKIISAEYAASVARITDQAKDYSFAGEKLITAMQNASDSSMAHALSEESFKVLQRAIELDTTNDDNKVNMAICLMEGKTDVMSGVKILLPLVKKNPNHLKANYILGKFAVVSGQYEKAIARLEKVINLDKHFTSAYIVLSQAYIKMGNKTKAMETLKECKKNLDDLQAKAELQKMIEQL